MWAPTRLWDGEGCHVDSRAVSLHSLKPASAGAHGMSLQPMARRTACTHARRATKVKQGARHIASAHVRQEPSQTPALASTDTRPARATALIRKHRVGPGGCDGRAPAARGTRCVPARTRARGELKVRACGRPGARGRAYQRPVLRRDEGYVVRRLQLVAVRAHGAVLAARAAGHDIGCTQLASAAAKPSGAPQYRRPDADNW
jgi:hypothetical protein